MSPQKVFLPSKFLMVVFLALATSGCALVAGGRSTLLTPGVRGGSPLQRSQGWGWLALCRTGPKQWALIPAATETRLIRDGKRGQPGSRMRHEILSNRPEALCLLRHREVGPGSVVPADFNSAQPLGFDLLKSMGSGVPVVCSIDAYRLGAVHSAGEPSRYTLQVSVNERAPVVLEEFERGGEPAFERALLIWAGDLNRDGVADFLIERSSSGWKTRNLYLSRKAGESYQRAGMDAWEENP